jgi:uncharacterized protein YebE (UPF0316 family)
MSFTIPLVVIPILIFIAKILDVTFGTIRIIFISRSRKYLAPIFGFCEIMIWLFAISQIMQHLTNIYFYLAYALGYATGNFVGVSIEEKMALGMVVLRIITKTECSLLVDQLRSTGYGVTCFDGEGSRGNVKLVYMTIERKDTNHIISIIKKFHPHTFFSIEEVRAENAGIFPDRYRHGWVFNTNFLRNEVKK